MPLLLAADENFNRNIVRGIRRRDSSIDVVCIQDVGLSAASDLDVLAWAAQAGRVILTHDVSTMTKFANERVSQGLPMPGVFEVPRRVPVSLVIEELLLLSQCSLDGEWEGQIRYLPLR